MRLIVQKYLKKAKTTVQVRQHIRRGRPVKQHNRNVGVTHGIEMKTLTHINAEIDKNMGWIVFMAKKVSDSHGISVDFEDGQPVNDLADIVSEGKVGMIRGGMEWENRKGEHKVDRLTQMKFRAKKRMLNIAKTLNTQVKRPRDFIKHQTIINNAINKLTQKNGGNPPTPESVANIITLKKRGKDGKQKKLSYRGTLHRIYEINEHTRYYEQAGSDVWHQMVGDEDVKMWTTHTKENREIIKKVTGVLEQLVATGELTKEQYDILQKRYYLGKKRMPSKPKSYESIAIEISERDRPEKERKKIGDYYHIKIKNRKVPVYAEIVDIVEDKGKPKQVSIFEKKKKKAYFIVKVDDRYIDVKGKPPYKRQERKTTPHDIIDIHSKAVKIIKPHLEHLVPLLEKSKQLPKFVEWLKQDYKLTL